MIDDHPAVDSDGRIHIIPVALFARQLQKRGFARITEQAVKGWISKGKLEAIRLPNKEYGITIEAARRFFESHRVGAEPGKAELDPDFLDGTGEWASTA